MSSSPNFNKSFEALYQIAMAMADNCIVKNTLPDRFNKLDEEYKELRAEIINYQECSRIIDESNLAISSDVVSKEKLTGELADVLFVLLHTAHTLGVTPFELLHQASSKMLGRMNDEGYVAKN